jgi:hypothetical protein
MTKLDEIVFPEKENWTEDDLLSFVKDLTEKYNAIQIQINAHEREVQSHLGVLATLYKQELSVLTSTLYMCKESIEEVKSEVNSIYTQTSSLSNGGMQKALETALTSVIKNWGDINLATKIEQEKRVSKVTVGIIAAIGSIASAVITYLLTHP